MMQVWRRDGMHVGELGMREGISSKEYGDWDMSPAGGRCTGVLGVCRVRRWLCRVQRRLHMAYWGRSALESCHVGLGEAGTHGV
jgi:hypothetical protein